MRSANLDKMREAIAMHLDGWLRVCSYLDWPSTRAFRDAALESKSTTCHPTPVAADPGPTNIF